MLLIYMLLSGIPKDTRDLKERYGFPFIVIPIFGEVITTFLELIMGMVAIDVITHGIIPVEAKACVAEYLVDGFLILLPAICLLIAGLISSGLLVESVENI